MAKWFFLLASINGFLAVGLGAFGAHALKEKLSSEGMSTVYQTGNQYHFYHTLALLLISVLFAQGFESNTLLWSGRFMFTGIILFSGSLYILAITGTKILGAITPLGGLCFLAGWACLGYSVLKWK